MKTHMALNQAGCKVFNPQSYLQFGQSTKDDIAGMAMKRTIRKITTHLVSAALSFVNTYFRSSGLILEKPKPLSLKESIIIP